MLDIVQKKKKRILITIDGVTNNQYIKGFASAFQIFIRNDYPVFLLMTGLYNNIYSIQNNKSLTFLYRTPKIKLDSLNASAIKNSYMKVFQISEENAKKLSSLTQGYSFGFQALGYAICRNGKTLTDINFDGFIAEILPMYDQILHEYSYEKIWSKLSANEKLIAEEMAKNKELEVGGIRELLGMSSNSFNVYKTRMQNKGVITSEGYVKLSFSLPRFDYYILSITA